MYPCRKTLACLAACMLLFTVGCERKGGSDPLSGTDGGTTENGIFLVIGSSGRQILSGDDTPTTADGTDFGVQPPEDGTVTGRFFMRNNDDDEIATVIPDGNGVLVRIEDDADGVFSVDTQPGDGEADPDTGVLLPIEVTPNLTLEFRIAFTPLELEEYSATVAFDYIDFDGQAQTFTYAIQGVGGYGPNVNEIRVSGRELQVNNEPWIEIISGDRSPAVEDGTDFGVLEWNDAEGSSRTFLIENLGGQPLSVSNVSISTDYPDDWEISQAPSLTELPGYIGTGEDIGGSTVFEITFRPLTSTSQIVRPATVTIANNDSSESESPYIFRVVGRVESPDILVTGEPELELLADGSQEPSDELGTEFGSLPVNGARTLTFNVRNLGNGRLDMIDTPPVTIIDGIETDADGTVGPSSNVTGHSQDFAFNFDDTENTLGPLDDAVYPNQTTFTVTFRPTGIGSRQAVLVIPSNDPDEAFTYIRIRGEGYLAAIEVSGPDREKLAEDPPVTEYNPIGFLHESRYELDNNTSETNSTRFRAVNVRNTGEYHWYRIANPATSGKRLLFDGTEAIFVIGDHAADFLVKSHQVASPAEGADPILALDPGEEAYFALAFRPITFGTRRALIGIRLTEEVLDGGALLDTVDPFVFEVAGLGLAPDIRVFGHTGGEIRSGDIEPSPVDGTEMPHKLPVITLGYNRQGAGDAANAIPSTFEPGTFDSVTFTIENVGNAPLILSGTPRVQISGFFAQAFYVPRQEHVNQFFYKPIAYEEPQLVTVEPNQTVQFEMFYDPILPGYNQATVTIRSNDPDEDAFYFDVRCFGADPTPVVLGRNNVILDEDDSPRAGDLTRFPDLDGGFEWGDFQGANEGWGYITFEDNDDIGGTIDDNPDTFENEFDPTMPHSESLRFGIRNDGNYPLVLTRSPNPTGADFGYVPLDVEGEYVRLGDMGLDKDFSRIDDWDTPDFAGDDVPVVNRPGRYWEDFVSPAGGVGVGAPPFQLRAWSIAVVPEAGTQEYNHLMQQLDTGAADGFRAYVDQRRSIGLSTDNILVITGMKHGVYQGLAGLPDYVVGLDGDPDVPGDPDMSIWRVGDSARITGMGMGRVIYVGDNFVQLDRTIGENFTYLYMGDLLIGTSHVAITSRLTQHDFTITEQPTPTRFGFGPVQWELDPGEESSFSIRFKPRWCNYDAIPASPEYDPPFAPQGEVVSIWQGDYTNGFDGDGDGSGPDLILAYRYDENEQPIDQDGDGLYVDVNGDPADVGFPDPDDLRPIDLGFMQRCTVNMIHNSTKGRELDPYRINPLTDPPYEATDYKQDREYDFVIKGRTKFIDVDVSGYGEVDLAASGVNALGDAQPTAEIRIPDGLDDVFTIWDFNNDYGDVGLGSSKAFFYRIANVSTDDYTVHGRGVAPHIATDPETGLGYPLKLMSAGTTVLGTRWITVSNSHAHDFRVYTKMADFIAARPSIDPNTPINGSALQSVDLLLDQYTPTIDDYDQEVIIIPDGEDALFIVEFVPTTSGERFGSLTIPTDDGEKAAYTVPVHGGLQTTNN